MTRTFLAWHRNLLAFAALFVLATTAAWAGKYNNETDIGDKPAAWSKLPTANGDAVSLSDFSDKKAVAIVFTCNNCPVARAYEGRLIALAEQYKDKPVGIVAINVNEGESLEQMKQRAEEKGFNFPYAYDASQQSAKNYGAQCTPHVFLLDPSRAIVYMGAIDDNMREDAVSKHYLKDAIDSVLKGQQPAVQETRQMGCGIDWR